MSSRATSRNLPSRWKVVGQLPVERGDNAAERARRGVTLGVDGPAHGVVDPHLGERQSGRPGGRRVRLLRVGRCDGEEGEEGEERCEGSVNHGEAPEDEDHPPTAALDGHAKVPAGRPIRRGASFQLAAFRRRAATAKQLPDGKLEACPTGLGDGLSG